MSTPTTRRYPRSLAEAFPDVRAYAIEHTTRHRSTLADIALAVVIGAALATALVYGWAA